MLAKNKLNVIEILMSQALNDLDVSHEEFVKIIREKDKSEEIKKNVKNDGMSKKLLVNKVIYKEMMNSYCLVCKRNTENRDSKVVKTKNGRYMLSSKCAVCGSKKSRFVKEQDTKGILSNLVRGIPLVNLLV